MNARRFEPTMATNYQRLHKLRPVPVHGKWNTSDNELGDATLKQHFYIECDRTEPYTHRPYKGNRALCSPGGLSDDGERFLSIAEIEGELQREDCCGRCRQILKRLNEAKKA